MNLKNLSKIILLVAVFTVLSIVPVNAVVFNAAFDSEYYVNSYADLKAAFGNDANAAYKHFVEYGIKEGRVASPVFDVKTYVNLYPDLQAAFGTDYQAAYNHFLNIGINEGRTTSPEFNVRAYLALYPDLQAAFGNDLAAATRHFVTDGIKEGRLPGASDTPMQHVHDWKLTETKLQATCQSDGTVVYTCSVCKETKTEVVKASADYHQFLKVKTEKAATATETGIDIYQCKICGEVETRITPVLECKHNEENPEKTDSLFTVTKSQAATCKAAGEKRYTCSVCGKEIVKILPMLEHESLTDEGRGAVIADAVKCVSDGSEEVTCRYCGEKFVRPISAHRYEVIKEIPATCTEPTKVVSKCKDCGAEKTEVKVVNRVKSEPLGHNITETVEVAVTCTTDGRIAKVCSRCGYTEKVPVPAKGHKETNKEYYAVKYDEKGNIVKINNTAIENYKPGDTSCEYAIAEYFTCSNPEHKKVNNSNEVVTVVAEKQAHSIDTTKTVVKGIFLCDDKGNITINYDSEGKVAGLKNAKVDCTHAEAEVFTCKTCEQLAYNITTEKTKHEKLAGSERTVKPTCTDPGYTSYTCSICKAEVRDTEIAKLGHNFAIKAANCTDNAKIYCTLCNKTATVTEAAGKYTITTATGLDKEAVEKYFATLTDAQKATVIETSLGGHDFTGISMTTKDGVKGKYCTKCQEFVPAADTKVAAATAKEVTGDLLGKQLSDLQDTVTVDVATGKITGSLNKVTNYTGFSSNEEEQNGYYLVLYFADAKAGNDVTVKTAKGTYPVDKADGLFILYIKDATATNTSITVESTNTQPVTLSLSGLTLKAN